MNRFWVGILLFSAFCVACKTVSSSGGAVPASVSVDSPSPTISSAAVSSSPGPVSLTKFGAGSVEESAPAPASERAEMPLAIQRVRTEEILAQATLHEAELDRAISERNYPAAIKAFESLSSLVVSVPAGMNRLNEDRKKIELALDSIHFEIVSQPPETVAGTAFKKDFSVLVYTVESGAKKPLPGFECAVFYPSVAADGSKVTLSETRASSAEGIVAFTAPVPARSGKDTVVLSSTLTSSDPLLRESFAQRKEKGQLASAFPHVVSSNARRLATTISILDYDRNGKAILSSNASATILLKPLVQKGFSRIGMADFPNQLASGDEEALLKAAKAQFGTGVQRFIYGTVRLDSLSQGADGLWSCTMTASVTCHDFVTNATVCRIALTHTDTGKTEALAIDAARKRLAGELLVQDLYYNM